MELCTHQVQYNGLCAVCGSLLESDDPKANIIGNHINMGYDTLGLTVSREEAERLEAENARRLLKNRKLSLILDLDQTIVHASWDQRIDKYIENEDNGDLRRFKLPGSDLVYYLKMRPGLNHFLKEIEDLYELHIYTMGTRDYAEAVAKEIDADGSIFKERILSRDESGSVTQKKLQRLFPCDTSMVVVLDDRSDVWSFSPNLVRIKPYEFFMGTGDINCPFIKMPTTSITRDSAKDVAGDPHGDDGANNKVDTLLPEENTKQDTNNNTTKENSPLLIDDDNELYTMLNILKDIHKEFYAMDINDKQTDVTLIIPAMKKKVLTNVVLAFTDVIPEEKDPTMSWIWQMAASFGAVCSMDLTGKTTHLVAVKFCSKVKAAKEYGHSVHVVTPAWLLDSTARWSIQDESKYEILAPVNNTDYTSSVDLDDSTYDDENNKQSEEEGENINWDEADREVEDFINESGIDDVWDTDSDTVESSFSELNTRWKRKKSTKHNSKSGGESGGDVSDDDNIGILARRKRPKRGKSQLSKVTTNPDILTSSNCTSGNNSDDDLSSLDELVDILDEALE